MIAGLVSETFIEDPFTNQYLDVPLEKLVSFYCIYDLYYAFANPRFTIDEILNVNGFDCNNREHCLYLSKNPSLTLDDVLKHPEIRWDYAALSTNRKIVEKLTVELVTAHNWDLLGLVKHGISFSIVTMARLKWDPYAVVCSVSMSLDEFIEYQKQHKDGCITLAAYSKNPHVRWRDVVKRRDLVIGTGWDFATLAKLTFNSSI